jgi:hypothetical protein
MTGGYCYSNNNWSLVMSDADSNLSVLAATIDSGKAASPGQIRAVGVGLMFFILLMIYLFVNLWPWALVPGNKGSTVIKLSLAFDVSRDITIDTVFILLVMLSGGIGSFVHTATSFGDFVGNQRLTTNWIWWYLLRPFTGMALSFIMYMSFRGGFLTVGDDPSKINIYAIVALAAMVGMFSKQATDKLSETFNTIFKTSKGNGDDTRQGGLNDPPPLSESSPDGDRDACGLEVVDVTADEDLPPAKGGVV